MAKTKKFSILLCSFLLMLASFLFVACGKIDYSKTSLSASPQYLEVFVGEEKNLTISIENPVGDMSKLITFTKSSDKCDIVETTHKDYSTVYTITGKEGGRTTIDFMAVDGGAKITVDVLVRQYSEGFSATNQSLFVTEESQLIPSKADFVFDNNVSERDLDFYFYGKYAEGQNLTLDSVKLGDKYINQFVSAALVPQDGNKYLIFTDKEGKTYSMTGDDKVSFIEATAFGNHYSFNGTPKEVLAGEEYVFVARYVSLDATKTPVELFATKKVCVFDTIDIITDIENDPYIYYKDKNNDVTSYDSNKEMPSSALMIDGMSKGAVTFIPYYSKTLEIENVDKTVDFLSAFVKISVAHYNPLLKVKAYSEDTSVVTGKLVGQSLSAEDFWYQINCAQGNKTNTNFVIHFYYEGFEDSTNEQVSFRFKVPVEIRNVPNTLYINNYEYKKGANEEADVYTFYNHYEGNAGWVPLDFMINPTSAEYQSFEIDLTGTGLTARYQNKFYGGEGQPSVVPVTDLSQMVYVRGLEGATEAYNRTLPIKITVDFIGTDVLVYEMNYQLVNGAAKLIFAPTDEDAQLFKTQGLYLDINGGSQDLEGMIIALDGEDYPVTFEHITVNHVKSSGEDVAAITMAATSSMGKLDLTITPRALGENVQYTVALDNGVELEVPLVVSVKESLSSAFVETQNEDGLIKIPSEQPNTYYIYNDGINVDANNNTKTVDFHVYSNDNKDSKAIDEVNIRLYDTSTFAIYQQSANGRNFNMQIRQNGKLASSLAEEFTDANENGVYDEGEPFTDANTNGRYDANKGLIVETVGYQIAGFKQTQTKIYIPIQLYAYSFIDGIVATKVEEDVQTEANVVEVYTNVNSIDLRRVELAFDVIQPEIQDGYLFKNETTGLYEASEFEQKFIYWEISKIGQDTKILKYPEADSGLATVSLSIDEGDFVLDTVTGRLTFIARSKGLVGKKSLTLLTHVRQYGKLFTYTTKINIEGYVPVEAISFQEGVSEIILSAIKREFSAIVVPAVGAERPTDPRIDVKISYSYNLTTGGFDWSTVESKLKKEVVYDEGTGKTQIKISLPDEFLAKLNQYYNTTPLVMKLQVFATDWIEQGSVSSDYSTKVIDRTIRFENGTEKARFTLSTAEELLAIKDDLTAHYQISGMIDASPIIDKLPLGELTGSLVGTKDFAKIYGLNFTNPDSVGLFTGIGTAANKESAYIHNLTFEGSFKWSTVPSSTASIGLIAGVNYGTIENVNVVLAESNIKLGAHSFGVLVGINYGTISHNFKHYDKYQLNTDGSYVLDDNGNVIIDSSSLYYDTIQNKLNYIYEGCAPKSLVYMNEELRIIATGAANIGGLVGYNAKGAVISKTESYARYYGYSNYTAYVNINTSSSSSYFVGGIAGKSSGVIKGDAEIPTNVGLLLGGIVIGDKYVGGVAGQIDNDGDLSYVTTRTFVRGEIAALVANTSSTGVIASKITVEAIDDGRLGKEASMGVVYSSESFSEYEAYFGYSTSINTLANSSSYITRENVSKKADGSLIDTPLQETLEKSAYYGDFIVVHTNNTMQLLGTVINFTSATTSQLNVEARFNNEMKPVEANSAVAFYTYHFNAASFVVNTGADLSEWQNDFDLELNSPNVNSQFYPFKSTSREIKFTSLTPDVLTIAQNGTITIKSAGVAHIEATSLLNTNSGLDFFVFVTNYFDSESDVVDGEGNPDHSKRTSIIYPNSSPSSVPIGDTTIELRGDNTANLYIRPKYDYDSVLMDLVADKYGVAQFQGIAFNLATNLDVSVKLPIEKLNQKKISTSISGQTIYIKRGDEISDGQIDLVITPILKTEIKGVVYTADVNKTLTNANIDYKKGAIEIVNMKYVETPIYSSADVNDEIRVTSTANVENAPLFQVFDSEGNLIQENTSKDATGEGLFNIKFTPVSGSGTQSQLTVDPNNKQTFYNHVFKLNVSVNKNDYRYLNRYNQNIYGTYKLKIIAESNNAKSVTIDLKFGQTEIVSVPIDNYTKLADAKNSLPSKSEKAYPGESGLLEITLSPEDADFDSVIIENDDVNFTTGHANAVFTLLARKNVPSDDSMFDSSTITGSQGSKGLEIRFDDILNLYTKGDVRDKYVDYNGVIYVQYDFSSENVLNDSVSRINVKFMKDGEKEPLEVGYKDLTIKLQQFVGIELEGKVKTQEGDEYYSSYTVARGLRYKLRINSYGFDAENVSIQSLNPSLGEIVQEEDGYYLQITSSPVLQGQNSFAIEVSALQEERNAASLTHITVKDFVVNYNSEVENPKKPDIVTGMGNGIINIQVGTQITFAVDIYEYLEYDPANSEVLSMIDSFLDSLSERATWTAHTNLIDDETVVSPTEKNPGLMTYIIRPGQQNENYYFRSNGLNIIPVHTHKNYEEGYYFTLKTTFKEDGTRYAFDGSGNGREISTEFIFNVYTSSSEETPIPVYNYKEFTEMQDGHYILMTDITLPNKADANGEYEAFIPVAAKFKSLDGNGYTIHFDGTYDFGAESELGVFKSIEDAAVVKNLNVNFKGQGNNGVVFKTSSDAFTLGGVAATNGGSITNCHVFSTNQSTVPTNLTVDAPNAINGESYIAGITATNTGYITNSSVKLNLQSVFYMAGVVANNSGKIAATSFKGGTLTGMSTNQRVSGFAYQNTTSGQIITSYVSGKASDNEPENRAETTLYSSGSKIVSTQPSAGFIFENSGMIKDCYSDIAMDESSARKAGFVYTNGGTIKNSFSLAILKSNNEGSAGFAMENSTSSGVGELVNCFYYYEPSLNINTALAQVDETFGIKRLTKADFSKENLGENFAEYSYSETPSTRAVWFYSDVNSLNSPYFKRQAIEFSDYTSYGESEAVPLPVGRLELVSANIFTYSRKVLDENNKEVDSETGDVVYHYYDFAGAPNRGTINNPLLLSTAKNTEDLIYENATSANVNTSYYRMISDINYNDDIGGVEGYSKLHSVIFAGVLEGNGMEVSEIGLVSMEKLSSAGLFAQIGYSNVKTGSVKNLTVSPREVAFNSAESVGTMAGVLKYGYLYDIDVGVRNTDETASLTVSGMNFVGGVVGRAVGQYEMKDIYSNLNASAGSDPAFNYMYSDEITDCNRYSYAGSIAGYLGNGNAYNMYVYQVSSVMGGRAGFAYGGIGKDANVWYTYVSMKANAKIRAYQYGGFVAGEVGGNLYYSHVENSGNSIENAAFLTIPKAPMAVGGIAGRLNGGRIDNAVMEQGFALPYNEETNQIEIVGGLVGIVQADNAKRSYLVDSIMSGDVSCATSLGGAIGQTSGITTVDSVAVTAANLTVEGPKASPALGGLIAKVSSATDNIVIANTYTNSKLTLNTYTSGTESVAKIGGYIGLYEGYGIIMRNCYTTSTADVEVYDSRAIGASVDYKPDTVSEKIKFQQIVQEGNDISEVYYLGNNSEGTGLDGYGTGGPFLTSFKFKVKSATIGLQVNQFGTSSIQYNLGDEESAFYGLYGADYDYIDENGKSFLLRYDGKKKSYTAYDKLREFLSSNYLLKDSPIHNGDEMWWLKETGLGVMDLSQFKPNEYEPTAFKYDTVYANNSDLKIATTYRYFVDEKDTVVNKKAEIKLSEHDPLKDYKKDGKILAHIHFYKQLYINQSAGTYSTVKKTDAGWVEAKNILRLSYDNSSRASGAAYDDYRWNGKEFALLYNSTVHGNISADGVVIGDNNYKPHLQDGFTYLQKYNKISKVYEDITLDLNKAKMYNYVVGRDADQNWSNLKEIKYYTYIQNPNVPTELECVEYKANPSIGLEYCSPKVDTTKLVEMGMYRDEQLNVYQRQYNEQGLLVYKNLEFGGADYKVSTTVYTYDSAKGAFVYTYQDAQGNDVSEYLNITTLNKSNFISWGTGSTDNNQIWAASNWNHFFTTTSVTDAVLAERRAKVYKYNGDCVTVDASSGLTLTVHHVSDPAAEGLQLVWSADMQAQAPTTLALEKHLDWLAKLDWYKAIKEDSAA